MQINKSNCYLFDNNLKYINFEDTYFITNRFLAAKIDLFLIFFPIIYI